MWLEATYHIYPSYGFSSPPIKIVKSFLMLIMACCQSWVGNSGPGTVPLEQGVNKKLDTLLSLLLAFFLLSLYSHQTRNNLLTLQKNQSLSILILRDFWQFVAILYDKVKAITVINIKIHEIIMKKMAFSQWPNHFYFWLLFTVASMDAKITYLLMFSLFVMFASLAQVVVSYFCIPKVPRLIPFVAWKLFFVVFLVGV